MWPLIGFVLLGRATGRNAFGSLVHAVVTSAIALQYVPLVIDADVAGAATPWAFFSAQFTMCYMLYDLWYIRHASYYLHHALAIGASAYVLYTRRFANLVLLINVNEVSSIFFALTYLKVYPMVTRPLFVVSFVTCRIVWLAWVIRFKFIDDLLLRTILNVHYAMNAYWLLHILHRCRARTS